MNTLRDLEHYSIHAFVKQAASEGYLSGRVLDYGCGKQPYRDIVEEAGGEYFGHDFPDYPASTVSEIILDSSENWFEEEWDAILCTQVVQYIPIWVDHGGDLGESNPLFTDLYSMYAALDARSGYLVMTYPTHWPEVEAEDFYRFTKAGMERLLTDAGFTIVMHQRRETFYGIDNVKMIGEVFADEFALGYGVVARA